MSPIIKFMGGFLMGVTLGAGVYVLITRDSEDGIIGSAKTFINNVIEEGKQAAEMRRTELQIELG